MGYPGIQRFPNSGNGKYGSTPRAIAWASKYPDRKSFRYGDVND